MVKDAGKLLPQSQPAAAAYDASSFTAYGYPASTTDHVLNPPPPPPVVAASDVGPNQQTRQPKCTRYNLIWACFVIIFMALTFWGINSASKSQNNAWPQLDLDLESFAVSNLTVSANQISGNWKIRLHLTNPNPDFNIVYEDIKVEVFYSDDPVSPPAREALSSQEITSKNYTGGGKLVQKPKNQTVIYLEPAATLKGLDNWVADSMIRDVIHGGFIEFDMQLQMELEFVDLSPFFGLPHPGTWLSFSMIYPRIKVPLSPSNSPLKNATGVTADIPEPHLNSAD